jgi:hypothetical protein
MLEQSVLEDRTRGGVESLECFADEPSQFLGGERGECVPQAFGASCFYDGHTRSFGALHVVTVPQTAKRPQEPGASRYVASVSRFPDAEVLTPC